jgi:uracil-DNA glycosylase
MKENLLETIKNQVISCTKCELCKSRKNAVPGKGSSNAEIVFIGEAPGRSEDLIGEPFVGSAGKRLTEALDEAGLSRDAVYITNVVKCRPPDNRVPNQKERETCRSYLEQELAILEPKIICVMGNTAYNSLLDGKDITKNRGKFLEKDGRLYFITIHPAATIYNQELVSVLKEDIKKLHDKLL